MVDFTPTRENQLSEKSLSWGYWWVNNKVKVRQWSTIALGVLGFALVIYGAYGLIDWFFGYGVRERLTGQVLNIQNVPGEVIRKSRPQPLTFGTVQSVQVNEQSYDLYDLVTNPNGHAWTEFDYQFFMNGTAIGTPKHDFLLPGSTKMLYQLGAKLGTYPSGAELRISEMLWHKVNYHIVKPDYPTWAKARLEISVSDIVFRPPNPTETIPVSRATFKVRNNTAFSYWKAGFFVALVGAGGTIGVNYVAISELRAGQTREVDASWFNDLTGVESVEVTPDINIFDDRVYIPPGR